MPPPRSRKTSSTAVAKMRNAEAVRPKGRAKKAKQSDDVPQDGNESARRVSLESSGEDDEYDAFVIRNLIKHHLWVDDLSVVNDSMEKLLCPLRKWWEWEDYFEAGGHLAVLKAMEKYNNSLQIQIDGCFIFGNIISNDVHSIAATAIANIGGVVAVLSAMKNFPDAK